MFDIPDPRLPFNVPTNGFTRTFENDRKIIQELSKHYPDLCPKGMEIKFCVNQEALGDWKYISLDKRHFVSDVSEVYPYKYCFFSYSVYPNDGGGHMMLLHITEKMITIYDSSRLDQKPREYILSWPFRVPTVVDILKKIWKREVVYADIPVCNLIQKDVPLLKNVSLRWEGYCVVWSIIFFLLIKNNININIFGEWTEQKLTFYALACYHVLTQKSRFTRNLIIIDYTNRSFLDQNGLEHM